jgi:hypothetical protein
MQPSRHSSTSCDDAGPSKRQKVYRACLACVNSKTRCEDVLPRDGCLRCRNKSKLCSLVEASVPQPVGDWHEDDLRARLDRMEEAWRSTNNKVDRLEQYTHSLPVTQPSSSTTQMPTPVALHPTRPVGIHELFTTIHWHSIAITERVYNVSSGLGYPDPVLRGIVTEDQMEMAFHS